MLQLYSVDKIALKCKLTHLSCKKEQKGIKLIGGVNWKLMDNFVICFSGKKYSEESKIGRCYFKVSVNHCDS